MKFVNLGDKHSEYDFFEDTPILHNEGKPHHIPSYIDTAKKRQACSKLKNSK